MQSDMSLFQERPELLESFFEGRRETLDEVYRIHRAPVDAYLETLWIRASFRGAGVPAIADVRQEVFLRAFSPRARATYDPTRRYLPYLMRIARNCFIDAVRVLRREVSLFDWDDEEEAGPLFAGFCEGTSDEVWDPWTEAIVEIYLARLPPRLRAVYDQRYVCGASQEIACASLGLTRRKLRTAEEHLKDGLRKALQRLSSTRSLGTRRTFTHNRGGGP